MRKTEVSGDKVTVCEVCRYQASTEKFEPCEAHDIKGINEVSIKNYRDWAQTFVEAAVEAPQKHNN